MEADEERVLLGFEARARAAGWNPEWRILASADGQFRALRVEVPNGREKVSLSVSPRRATFLEASDLSGITLLGHLDAVLFRDSDVIEARLSASLTPAYLQVERLARQFRDVPGQPGDEDEESVIGAPCADSDDSVILSVADSRKGNSLEISALTAPLQALSSRLGAPARALSLKIRGLGVQTHDEALSAIEQLGGSFLFDLDLRFGVSLEFMQRRVQAYRPRSSENGSRSEPNYPRVGYSTDALSLYRYARSAARMPLLEYLAYYQVLENSFSVHTHRAQIALVKGEINDPRFDPGSDDHISRLLDRSLFRTGSHLSERDQLKATLRSVTGQGGIQSFLESNESVAEAISNKRLLPNVAVVHKGKNADLIDSIADRVYDIRCQIVHSKADGTQSGKWLLPGSREVTALGPDIELVRHLAQKVVIAGGSSRALH